MPNDDQGYGAMVSVTNIWVNFSDSWIFLLVVLEAFVGGINPVLKF